MTEPEGFIEPYYYDYWGKRVETLESTRAALLEAMDALSFDVVYPERSRRARDEKSGPIVVREGRRPELPEPDDRWEVEIEDGAEFSGDLAELPIGYHTVRSRDDERSRSLIVCPLRCYLPPEMLRGKISALSTQLYALRSNTDWGIGDFTDLSAFAQIAARAGARAVALNPLHELHPHNPRSASPYSPSSRLFHNVLYIDVERVAEFDGRIPPGLHAIRAEEFVDYAGVADAKFVALEELFRKFLDRHWRRNDARARAFKEFVKRGGTTLERLATYEALAQYFRARDSTCYGWREWPTEYRSAVSPHVARFADEHRTQVDFFIYLQWIAEEQIGNAAADAHRASVLLYLDLAVGADANGAEVWTDRDAFVGDASLGAPADPLNIEGQNWGLAPISPRALRERAYRPFIELLRANMRHAGILRVDHAMALRRAFCIPRGAPASNGAYVRYPFDEMLGILALESVRNECAVVGEDLGTLPEGFRERLESVSALSTRLFYFSRDDNDGSFLPPERYPRLAAVSIGTHDLPTLAGWWTGDRSTGEDRAADRFRLIDALQCAGAVDGADAARLREDAALGGTLAVIDALSTATHRFLGRTSSMLLVVAIEDVLGELGAVNVPGTFEEHPNWRRKRSLSLEEIACDGRLMQIAKVLTTDYTRK